MNAKDDVKKPYAFRCDETNAIIMAEDDQAVVDKVLAILEETRKGYSWPEPKDEKRFVGMAGVWPMEEGRDHEVPVVFFHIYSDEVKIMPPAGSVMQ